MKMTLKTDLDLADDLECYQQKGLVKRYTHVNAYQSKDMANVKDFADKQTGKWISQKLYAPPNL